MTRFRATVIAFALAGLTAWAALPAGSAPAASVSAAELTSEAHQSLETLYRLNSTAASLAQKAKAILVFPSVAKAGLIFGGTYGEGVLLRGNSATDYYSSITATHELLGGPQSGGQAYGYAVFLMTDNALNYLNRSEGWEFGVGPTVVLIDEGSAKALAAPSLKDDAYAFIYGQHGLMVGIGIEGTKVSKIRKI